MRNWLVAVAMIFPMIAFAGETCSPLRDSEGKIKRSSYQVKKFRKANPCPSTGLTHGSCKGYQVDHIEPLSCCGVDRPSNMQWLSVEAHRIKTIEDNRRCSLRH